MISKNGSTLTFIDGVMEVMSTPSIIVRNMFIWLSVCSSLSAMELSGEQHTA